MSPARPPAFLALWTLAVVATVSAFVVHLALRSKSVQLGYELGHAQEQGARLREVKRVLELEAASYKTPERVEIVARTLLGMEPPPPHRIIALGLSSTAAGHAVRATGGEAAARRDPLPADGRRLTASAEGPP
jgi:cell division protein FtsL